MNKLLTIIDIILIIAIVQGFIFNVIIYLKNNVKDKSIFYLNATIFFFTISNLQSYVLHNNLINGFPLLKYTLIEVSWNIFIAPLFFLFLIHYLKIEKHYRYILRYTFFVFIGLIVARLFFLNHFENYFNTTFLTSIRRYNIWEDIFALFTTILVYSYILYIFFKLKNRFKYINSFNDLNWLKAFFIFTLIILCLWMFAIGMDYQFTNINTALLYTPLRLVTSILIYWLGYQGYNQYLLTSDRISLRTKLENYNYISVLEEKKSTLNKDDLKIYNNVIKTIETKLLFLNPLMSLESLAEIVGIHKTTLSKLINTYYKNNFTLFINNYRVNYAKRILLDQNYAAYTITSIGLECGFNSKSTFYKAFNHFIGKTPAEFRKQKTQ